MTPASPSSESATASRCVLLPSTGLLARPQSRADAGPFEQETANFFGARVEASDHREYGEAIIKVLSQPADAPAHLNKLFEGIPEESPVWMSHSDRLHSLPEGFTTIATTESAPWAAIAHNDKPIYGIQFHPEVTHSLRGKDVLQRFVINICGCARGWTMVRRALSLSLSCCTLCGCRR